jgi:TRAP-type transport system periplasmic protein
MKFVWVRHGARALLAVGVMCAVSAVTAKDLVLAEIHKPGHIIVQSEEFMASRLADRTRNELKLQIKHSGELGGEEKEWALVRSGSLDMARVNLTTLVADVPTVKLLSLPYLFRSRDHMWRVLSGEFGKRLAADVEKAGGVVLAYYDSGTRSFYTTKKPIRNRSDFAGLRIRIQNSPVYKDLITELGGTPVVIGYEKVTDALKNGEIDGAENNTPSYVTSDHYKFAKYYSLDEHSSVPEVLVMSKKSWDGLKPEQQQALLSAANDSSEYMKKLWADSETQALAKAKKEGVVVIEKSQIAMAGIESFATKLYSKYVTDLKDLDIVLSILKSK